MTIINVKTLDFNFSFKIAQNPQILLILLNFKSSNPDLTRLRPILNFKTSLFKN